MKTNLWGIAFLCFFLSAAGLPAQNFTHPVVDGENGLTLLMKKHQLSHSVAQVTPTVCALCGVKAPETSAAPPIEEVLEAWKAKNPQVAEVPKIEKVLIFCPDATGHFLVEKFPEDWSALEAASDLRISGTNVLPSVTPVCFGAIFTGAPPEIHGIRQYQDKYQKNPIKVQTLFDAFSEAGKKVVIISSKNCSIDLIFRGHRVEQITTLTSQESVDTAKKLLRESDYDLILCYDGNYDSTMHAKGVFAPESLNAMRNSVRYCLELTQVADEVWSGRNRLVVFAPDHGAHDASPNHGSHGTDSAEDAIVDHFYRIQPAR